jgi:hypothetical protein
MLGEAIVADVGPLEKTDKGEPRRSVTLVVLAGAREPQTIRGKLSGENVKLADGIEAYAKVAFLGQYRTGTFNGKAFHTVGLVALERLV